jgi:hypothetical protein
MPAIPARIIRIILIFVLVISFVLSRLSLGPRDDASMKRQNVHAFPPLYRVDANNGCLAGEFDRRNNRIQLGYVEIALKLLTRFPIFDEQQGLASVEIRIQTRIQATRRNPRWSKHRAEGAQQNRSLFIRSYDL